jgi:hypothetical protein
VKYIMKVGFQIFLMENISIFLFYKEKWLLGG